MPSHLLETAIAIVAFSIVSYSNLADAQATDEHPSLFTTPSLFADNWLVLGPFPKDHDLFDPVDAFRLAAPDAKVQGADGNEYLWTVCRSDSSGILNLKQYCESIGQQADHAVVYAVLMLQDTQGEIRNYYWGIDDGGTLWIDGKELIEDRPPGFYTLRSNRFEVDFSNKQSKECWIEAINFTGGFKTSLACGHLLSGRVLSPDGESGIEDASIDLVVNDNVESTVLTDRYGKFRIAPVAYADDVYLNITTGPTTTRYPEQGKLLPSKQLHEITIARPEFGVLVYHYGTNRGLASSNVWAQTELSDGTLLVADNSDKSLYMFKGERFRKHPDSQLHNFANSDIDLIAEGADGRYWISTWLDGFFSYQKGELKHWKEVGNKPRWNFQETSNGDCWVVNRKNQGQIFRISSDGKTTTHLLPTNNEIRYLAEWKGKLVCASPLGNLFIQTENFQFESMESPKFLAGKSLTGIFAGPNQRLWCSTNWGVIAFDQDLNLEKWQWPKDDTFGRSFIRFCENGNTWITFGPNVFSLQANKLVKAHTLLTEVHSAYPSKFGSLIVQSDSGITEIQISNQRWITHADGITGYPAIQTTPLTDGLIVSSYSAKGELGRRPYAAGQLFDSKLYFFSNDSDDLVGIHTWPYRYGEILYTTKLPLVRRNGDWERLEKAPYQNKYNTNYYYCVNFLGSDRIVLGSKRGFYEVQGNELVTCNLLASAYPDGVPASHEVTALHESASGKIVAATRCTDERRKFESQLVVIDGTNASTVELPENGLCVNHLVRYADRYFAGTNMGLFEFDEHNQSVHLVKSDHFARPFISGLEITPWGALWISTPESIFVMDADGLTSRLTGLSGFQNVRRINALTSGKNGEMIITTDRGVCIFEHRTSPPHLSLDRHPDDYFKANDGVYNMLVGRPVKAVLAARDDIPSVAYRYRIGGGKWRATKSDFTFPSDLKPGEYQVDFQAIDSDSLASNIKSARLVVTVPFLERLSTRLWFLGLSLVAIGTIATLWSSRRNAQNQLLVSEIQAKEERDLLLARVCHDLRSPLTVVGLCAEQLKDSEFVSHQTCIDLLGDSAAQMTYLTEQLLTYSKAQNQTIPENINPTNVESAFARIQKQFQLRKGDSKVELQAQIDTGAPGNLRIDGEALNEILGNLVSNAFRHTVDGAIVISCRSLSDGFVEIAVCDTGCGMTRETLAHVFAPYFQGDKRSGSGNLGLGMTIVHRLVECYSGTVEVSSQVGQGTSVKLIFPESVIDNSTEDSADSTTED